MLSIVRPKLRFGRAKLRGSNVVPTAKEMATAIGFVCNKLMNLGILESESWDAIYKLENALRNQGDARHWSFAVARDKGLIFKALADKQQEVFNPVVSVDGVSVDDSIKGVPPLRKLDISLELRYQRDSRILRWHFDQANTQQNGNVQHGPLFHLQFGGHAHQDRLMDLQIKVPRWSHPPMDLVLLLEAVTANFFPQEWEELRNDRQWCEHVRLAQNLCLRRYSTKLQQHLSTSDGTLLDSLWGDRWLN